MNTKKNQNVTRKATALLGAIAAGSFLSLPALAGQRMNEQAQDAYPLAQQTQCVPNSVQSNAPADTATPNSSSQGAAQLPNQSDPRTGVSSSGTTVTDQGSRASNSNASTQTASSGTQMSDRNASNTYGNVLSQGGASSGGFARQQVEAANDPDATRTSSAQYNSNRAAGMVENNRMADNNSANGNRYTYSGRTADYGSAYGSYGDVLSQGGATSGGFASRQVFAANDRDNARNSNMRYNNSQASTMEMNSAAAATSPNNSLRSDTLSQSSNQSGQTSMNGAIACGPGTTPRTSTPQSRQAPGQSDFGTQSQSGSQMNQSSGDSNNSSIPASRQSTDQSKPQTQTPPQQSDLQRTQSPADNNGSGGAR